MCRHHKRGGREMWRDKSPGLKILWLWTFGTVAVLVTNVMWTRMRGMEHVINAQHHDPPDAATGDNTHHTPSESMQEES